VQVDAVGGVMLDGVQEMFERTTAGLKVSEKRFRDGAESGGDDGGRVGGDR